MTKAQDFRNETARANQPPKPAKKKRKPLAGTPLTPTARNESKLAGRRGGAALEDVAPGETPSRKSTRGSSDGTKRTTNQQLRAVRETRSPVARATRAQARSRGSNVRDVSVSSSPPARPAGTGTRAARSTK